jgi:hypothetical protein
VQKIIITLLASERVIQPMVLGDLVSQGKVLLRGWCILNGWSVSNKRHIKKYGESFRTDRILSMTFTGSFIVYHLLDII